MSLATPIHSASGPAPCETHPTHRVPSPPAGGLRHLALGLAYALKPRRLGDVVPLSLALARDMIFQDSHDLLPTPARALKRPDGYCGIVRDLELETLKEAYARGLFPFSHIGPIKWWAPHERSVLFFDRYKQDKNARRKLRNHHFTVTFDKAFSRVVAACAEPRPGAHGLTWINEQIFQAYVHAHYAGAAHSVEVWDQDGHLVGGAYGYVAGRVFFTESQFHRVRDASKVGFSVLNRHLQSWGFALNDGKDHTGHLASMGFAALPRSVFCELLDGHARAAPPRPGRWAVEPALLDDDWVPHEAPGLTGAELLEHVQRKWGPASRLRTCDETDR